MKHNRVAQDHYRSQFACGLSAAGRGADAARAKNWPEAFAQYEIAIDCFRKSENPYAGKYLAEATRCFATIGRIILEQEQRAECPAVGELPTFESLEVK